MLTLALAMCAAGLVLVPSSSVASSRASVLLPVRPGKPASRKRRRGSVDALAAAAAWDLLAACLRAGMPVADALRAVADGMTDEAAGALQRTSDLIALGAAPDEAWRPALDCPETAALAGAARRSARSGTALAGAAAELAQRARAELTDDAEARAQRAGVLITGPLGLCFLPGFLCLGVVPVVIGLAGQLTVMR